MRRDGHMMTLCRRGWRPKTPCHADGVTEMSGKSFERDAAQGCRSTQRRTYADSKEDCAFNQNGPLGWNRPFRKSLDQQRQNFRQGKGRR